MPRPSREPLINCDFFVWRLFVRASIYYADGRGNRPRLGKHSLGTTDRNDALARLKDLDKLKARERGLCTVAPSAESSSILSIELGWELYLKHASRPEVAGGAGSSTLKRYRSVRKKHERFCSSAGRDDWKQIDENQINAYGAHLNSSGLAPRTIYYELVVLKSVHRHLIASRLLPESLKIHLSLTRPVGSDTYCYCPAEVRRMLELCRKNTRLEWLGRVILTLTLTGLRIGELIALRRRDLQRDSDGMPIFLVVSDEGARAQRKQPSNRRRTKGRRSRHVPIHPRLRTLLGSLPVRSDGVLFVDSDGEPVTYNAILAAFVSEVIEPLSAEFPKVGDEIGFEDGRLHSFRHYFVSQSLLRGVSEGEIRDWIGHADTKLIDLYRHLAAHESRRRMEQLDLLDDRPATDGPSRASTGPSRSNSNGERESTGDWPTDEPVTAEESEACVSH